MGKSRFLKEISAHCPSVFICLRPHDSTGYPPRSTVIADFILERASNTVPSRQFDPNFDFNSFSTAKYNLFLLNTVKNLPRLLRSAMETNVLTPQAVARGDHSFMWSFFAEPEESSKELLSSSWTVVVNDVRLEMADLNTTQNLDLFTAEIGERFILAYSQFYDEYKRLGYPNSPPLLFLFDEARHLARTSAFDSHCYLLT
jgi:hypothetical protein